MKRAAIYARVSTEEQTTNYSLGGQLEACRAYAAEKGYTVVAEYSEAYSGATLERPELDKLRELLDSLDVVIVREIDRLARKVSYLTMIEDEFKRRGVDIEYVLGYDNTPEGEMYKNIQAALRQYERDLIFERTRRGRHSRARSGKVFSGAFVSYGYRYEAGQLHIVEDEAEIIRLIFHWYTVGDDSGKRLRMYEIACRLTQLGIPTRTDKTGRKRRGKPGRWNRSTLCKILENETYAGVWHYNKRYNGKENRRKPKEEWIAVEVPAIVDRTTFDLAQKYRSENKIMSKRNTKRPYLLRGRMRCANCGYAFEVSWHNYRCPGQNKEHDHVCTGVLRADVTDARIWDYLAYLIKNPEEWNAMVSKRQANWHSERDRIIQWLSSLAAQKVAIQQDESKLLDLYVSSTIDRAVLDRKIGELTEKRGELEQETGILEAQLQALEQEPQYNPALIYELSRRYRDNLDILTPEEQRQVVELFDVRVTVRRGETYRDHQFAVETVAKDVSGSVQHVWTWWIESTNDMADSA